MRTIWGNTGAQSLVAQRCMTWAHWLYSMHQGLDRHSIRWSLTMENPMWHRHGMEYYTPVKGTKPHVSTWINPSLLIWKPKTILCISSRKLRTGNHVLQNCWKGLEGAKSGVGVVLRNQEATIVTAEAHIILSPSLPEEEWNPPLSHHPPLTGNIRIETLLAKSIKGFHILSSSWKRRSGGCWVWKSK